MAVVAGAGGEIGLAREAACLIDQPLPPAAVRQRESHGGGADAELTILIEFLRIGAAQILKIEPAHPAQVKICRRVRVGIIFC